MTGPKTPFMLALPTILKHFGTETVSRKDLRAYCYHNHISLSHNLRHHQAGRGLYDLKPFIAAAAGNGQVAGGQMAVNSIAPAEPEVVKTDKEIEEDINARFGTLDLMTYGVVDGSFRSLIVSGNPGIGKTHTLEAILEQAASASKIMFTGIRGYVRATGIYRLLWEGRFKESVLMLDDADSVFKDETALNLLKGALDTTRKRQISWRSEKVFEAEDGENIPNSFDFLGAVIFVSNINFPKAVASGNSAAPHLEALMSRSFYLDLNLNNVRELIIRIKNVVANTEILTGMGVKKKDQPDIVAWVETNQEQMREISLRSVIKLGTIWKAAGGEKGKFTNMANATLLKRGLR